MTETNFRGQLYAAKETATFFENRDKKRASEARQKAADLEGNAIVRSKLSAYYSSVRDPRDRRRKIARAVFSYFSQSGVECRKSFSAPVNTPEEKFWAIAPEVIVF